MNNEIRIKNLALILNKLLLVSGNLNQHNQELNKILFNNKKKIDFENGVDMSLIEEISKSINK